MRCSYCEGLNCIKRGKRKEIQRYHCKDCNRGFQETYINRACLNHTNSLLLKLIKEGCGIRSISRILHISKNTVASRTLTISAQIQTPKFISLGCAFEVDELWSFVGNKGNATWITYAIERETKTVIDFFVGRKTKENIKPLIDKVLLLNPKRIYTDRLNIYPKLIPKTIHKVFRFCTNKIERMNLTLRTHIKRLSRRTICFSKNEKYLEAHLKIYFWG